jgi:hypothetical protein
MNRAAFLAATAIVAELVERPEVAARWHDESACAGMTVGGLAHHLVGQADNTVRFLSQEPTVDEPIPLLEHYARAAWVNSGHDSDANRNIRESADAHAAQGPDEVIATARRALARLPEVLPAPRDPDTVHIPWQGWSLSTEDWLVTRLMESVVHSDDLAVSIGVPTPEFPDDALRPVLELLSALSVRRHGQAAVIRALARAERATGSVAAF